MKRLRLDAAARAELLHETKYYEATRSGTGRKFREAVDDYLAACKKLGQPPDKPYSGRVMLRLPPDLHARASAAARFTPKGVLS